MSTAILSFLIVLSSLIGDKHSMPAELNIEKMIQEAMARGDFDNLKGKGKPIDLSAYFATPEDLRMAHSILKSNKFVPEEVDLLREIADLKQQIAACEDDDKRGELVRRLNHRSLAYSIAIEKYKRRK